MRVCANEQLLDQTQRTGFICFFLPGVLTMRKWPEPRFETVSVAFKTAATAGIKIKRRGDRPVH